MDFANKKSAYRAYVLRQYGIGGPRVSVYWSNKDNKKLYALLALPSLRRLHGKEPPKELITWLKEIIVELMEAFDAENG